MFVLAIVLYANSSWSMGFGFLGVFFEVVAWFLWFSRGGRTLDEDD